MQFPLTAHGGDGDFEFPAAVVENLIVREIGGQPHPRRWEGLIDTGAAITILPVEIASSLKMMDIQQRVRVWSYRRDTPRVADVYYVRLVFPNGVDVPTKAILDERRTVLIGRSALLRTRLEINWPRDFWTLAQESP